MFARFPAVFLLGAVTILPVLAAASAVPRTDPQISQCNPSSIQCCNSTRQPTKSDITSLFGLLGIVLGPLDKLIGLDCSPIIGAGASCTAQTVCCTDVHFNGLINIGCTPIILAV